MSSRRRWWLSALVLGVAVLLGCPEEFPQKPQLRVQLEPNPFDFGKAFVGTSVQSSVALTNKGLEDLVITQITITGDGVFTRYRPADNSPNPTIPSSDAGVPAGALSLVPGNKSSFYSVIFSPTADRSYSGTVTVTSNAENAPTQEIPLLGTGCAPSLADGGRPPGSLCEL